MAHEKSHIIGSTGDVNVFDYDAGIIYTDEAGIGWEFWQWRDESDESSKAVCFVYRVDVPQDVLEDFDWVDWEGVASSVGSDVAELRERGASADVRERVSVIEDAVGYHGGYEFDQYPLKLTRAELKKRWRNIKA